ncbi:hypothetical protein V8D89_008838 [Ganoderma adspersum]
MSRQDLLSTVNAVKSLLADTYIHLNSHSPPNKLPHELLVMVFQQALPTYPAISFSAIEGDGYTPILLGLKVITQVCRLWRNVAFGTPALWTRVDTRGYPAHELWNIVQRSDPLLLSFFLNQVYGSTTQDLLRSISSRLRRIDVNITQPTPPAIKELLSFDGSMLRCLTVSSPALNGQPILNGDNVTHAIPILQGLTDSLVALAVVPSTGWIPANHFPRLTHLYISLDTSSASPHPHDILFLLRNTPCLEIMHLRHLDHQETPPIGDLSESLPVELPHLRSLVFTVSAYHPVADILCALSISPSTLIRLDDLFVPSDTQYPDPIPAHLSPLAHATTMDLAVEDEMLFLVMQSASSGLWLKVRHAHNMFWDQWLLDLARTMSTPLRNLVSLRLDVYMDDEGGALALLPHAVQLSDLSVRFNKFMGFGALPLVRALCFALSQSQPGHVQAVCPSLRSLALEWPRNLPHSEDLGISDIVAMLSTRARLGQPIRRLVVQAIAVQLGTIPSTLFSEQLSSLAQHVEEYEERVDPDTHACAFEMRDMWNVDGVEDYWTVDEKLRPEYGPLWGYDDVYH